MSSITKQRIGVVILAIGVYFFIGLPWMMNGNLRETIIWTFMYIILLFMAVGAYLAYDN